MLNLCANLPLDKYVEHDEFQAGLVKFQQFQVKNILPNPLSHFWETGSGHHNKYGACDTSTLSITLHNLASTHSKMLLKFKHPYSAQLAFNIITLAQHSSKSPGGSHFNTFIIHFTLRK